MFLMADVRLVILLLLADMMRRDMSGQEMVEGSMDAVYGKKKN